jgi:hypothetical protein
MNRLANYLVIAQILTFASVKASEQRVQDLALDDHTVYAVPVSVARVTTVSFPSPIAAIDAALSTIDAKTPGLFQIAHSKGTAYFSARALAKGATTNLNVRWNGHTYVFELHECDDACYSLVLRDGNRANSIKARPLTPNRLLGLLDKAKAFALLQQYYPEAVHDVEYRDCRLKSIVSDCNDYEIRLIDAYRFPSEDTLIFELTLVNKSDKPLQHWPEQLETRVGEQVFTPSLADIAGIVAPHGATTGYVAITGNPTGGRNDLSLKNDFTFVLARGDRNSAAQAASKSFDALPKPILNK